jgi:hypothetical protein
MTDRFIVAELCKNWPEDPAGPTGGYTLAQLFERAINHNWERGYRLIDWKLSRVSPPPAFNETIIAIFELREIAIPVPREEEP